jgi:hypothetical protein
MAEPIFCGVLSSGLLTILVEIPHRDAERKRFLHLVHGKCGSRIRIQLFCVYERSKEAWLRLGRVKQTGRR